MKEIPLTRGYVALVDDEDFERVSKLKWHVKLEKRWQGTAIYAAHTVPSTFKTIRLHRFILNEPEGLEVDHWDGDGLNCTRANLRPCTHAQNQHNRRRQITGKSGVKGVWQLSTGNGWQAEIRVNNKRIYLGSFGSADEAAQAYREAAIKYHGDFASFKR